MSSHSNFDNHKPLKMQAAWGGALAAYPVFAIPYLLRLDASITLISVYVGLTALGPLVLGPAIVVYLQGSTQKRVWMLVSGFAARIGLFVPMLAPLFGENDAIFATAAFIVFAIPAIVYGALWIPIPGVAIQPEQRPEIISSRIRIANSGFMAANILFGAGMIFLTFPNNYYFIFVVSTLFGVLEIYNVSKIRVPKANLSDKGKLRSKLKTQKIEYWVKDVVSENNYKNIDNLIYNSPDKIMENVESRNTLIKTLSETTEVKTAIQLPMETLLNIANREISSYIENLDEDSKRDLSKVLMTEDTELSKEFEELKTKTIHSLSNLNESMDESTTKKLQETIQQIKGEVFSKINYVKLYNLYNNIN